MKRARIFTERYKPSKQKEWKLGSLSIHTNIDLLEDVINDVDLVCIMSVNPGFEDNHSSKTRTRKVEN
jgi:pentose-5-phosphate-3-epimerase